MNDPLRLAAYATYLGAWSAVAAVAVWGAFTGRRTPAFTDGTPGRVVLGTVLQIGSALLITATLPEGPLHPRVWELAGALAMAPLGAAIYIWALRSGRRADPGTLVTTGAYALVRHPIYLGFFALLVATGLLASSGVKLVAAAIVYLAGSELRIAYEEGDLADKFPDRHAEYKARTRWLYLPGAR